MKQTLLVGHVLLERAICEPSAAPGQPDESSPPIGWIRSPLDEAGFLHGIKTFRDATRREHRRGHELCGVELAWTTRSTKRGEEIEPAALQAVRFHGFGQGRVGELSDPKESTEESQGRYVEIGPLTGPLPHYAIDLVTGSGICHLHMLLPGHILLKKKLTRKLARRPSTFADPGSATLPATMHAIRLHGPTGAESLKYEVIGLPRLGEGQALVKVHAAAITRDELDWPVDRLPAIPSYEFSGVVASLGPGTRGPSIGDEVYALAGFDRDGAAADFLAVPAHVLAP